MMGRFRVSCETAGEWENAYSSLSRDASVCFMRSSSEAMRPMFLLAASRVGRRKLIDMTSMQILSIL